VLEFRNIHRPKLRGTDAQVAEAKGHVRISVMQLRQQPDRLGFGGEELNYRGKVDGFAPTLGGFLRSTVVEQLFTLLVCEKWAFSCLKSINGVSYELACTRSASTRRSSSSSRHSPL